MVDVDVMRRDKGDTVMYTNFRLVVESTVVLSPPGACVLSRPRPVLSVELHHRRRRARIYTQLLQFHCAFASYRYQGHRPRAIRNGLGRNTKADGQAVAIYRKRHPRR